MMFQGALLREQGVEFAVVIVKRSVLNSPSQRQEVADSFTTVFGGVPVILMAQDSRGVPTYWGRPDIVRFLANVPLQAIPWRETRSIESGLAHLSGGAAMLSRRINKARRRYGFKRRRGIQRVPQPHHAYI
jgi:hypothetical protein